MGCAGRTWVRSLNKYRFRTGFLTQRICRGLILTSPDGDSIGVTSTLRVPVRTAVRYYYTTRVLVQVSLFKLTRARAQTSSEPDRPIRLSFSTSAARAVGKKHEGHIWLNWNS